VSYDPRDLPDGVGPDVVARLEHRAAQERAARIEAERTAETQLRRAFERAREVELLASIAVIVNETDDALSAMSAAAKIIRRHCGFAVSHVLLREADGAFVTSDIWDADPAHLDLLDAVMAATVDRRFVPPAGLPGEVAASHLAAWIPDVAVNPAYARGEAAAQGAAWAFPIVVGIEVSAVVEFVHPAPMPADERLLQLAPSLAAQLGRAFEWEKVQERQLEDRRRLEEMLAARTQDVVALSRGTRGEDARTAYSAWVVHEVSRLVDEIRPWIGDRGREPLERLDRLIDSLIGIVDGTERRVAGPRVPVVLRQLLSDIAAAGSSDRCIVLVGETPVSDHPVELSVVLLRLAIDGLVSNAVQHSGSRVVELNAFLEDQAVVLEVRDTGIGYTWDQGGRPSGAGGLAQVARLAAALGGTVDVARVPGGGTSARLRVQAPVHVQSMSHDRSTRVLLVDDNDVNRRLAAAMLGKLGVATDVVDSGEAALDAMRETAYGLVLMDVQMPGMDGREATRAWRTQGEGATTADVPIVALTAHVGQAERDACRDAGMVDYLSKPFGLDDLSHMVQRWLEAPAGPTAEDAVPAPADQTADSASR
jgi:CheY-like chemotaxis protein